MDRRWQRLAATMGVDNMIATALMAANGLTAEQIIAGIGKITNKRDLTNFIWHAKAVSSHVFGNSAGADHVMREAAVQTAEAGGAAWNKGKEYSNKALKTMKKWIDDVISSRGGVSNGAQSGRNKSRR